MPAFICHPSRVLFVQSSEYVKAHGQLDLIVQPGEGQDSQEAVEDRLQSIVSLLFAGDGKISSPVAKEACVPATKEDMEVSKNHHLLTHPPTYLLT